MSRPQIPSVDEQPTTEGKTIRLSGVFVDEGQIATYGDGNANTGPISVIAISTSGEVTTLLADFDTEYTSTVRRLESATWLTSMDPLGGNPASVATDAFGAWGTREVQPDGLPVCVHLYDIGLDPSNGDLLAVGARLPDIAFVWRSNDEAVTWTEDLAHIADGEGFNRFYTLRTSNGLPVVSTKFGSPAYYVLEHGVWNPAEDLTFDPAPVHVSVQGLRLQHSVLGDLGGLPEPSIEWSAALGPDARIWLCDGTTIWIVAL